MKYIHVYSAAMCLTASLAFADQPVPPRVVKLQSFPPAIGQQKQANVEANKSPLRPDHPPINIEAAPALNITTDLIATVLAERKASDLPVDQQSVAEAVIARAVPNAPAQPTATPTNGTANRQQPAPHPEALLYEERSDGAVPIAVRGSVQWTLSGAADDSSHVAASAVASFPAIGLSALITIRSVGLRAARGIEIRFRPTELFHGGDVQNLHRVAVKMTEAERGRALVAAPRRIDEDAFSLDLASDALSQIANQRLLLEGAWIDIPVTYRTGQRAVVTVPVDEPGRRAINTILGKHVHQPDFKRLFAPEQVDQAGLPETGPVPQQRPTGDGSEDKGHLATSFNESSDAEEPEPETVDPDHALTPELIAALGERKAPERSAGGASSAKMASCGRNNIIYVRDKENLADYNTPAQDEVYTLRTRTGDVEYELKKPTQTLLFRTSSGGTGVPQRPLVQVDEEGEPLPEDPAAQAPFIRYIDLSYFGEDWRQVGAYMIDGDIYWPQCETSEP